VQSCNFCYNKTTNERFARRKRNKGMMLLKEDSSDEEDEEEPYQQSALNAEVAHDKETLENEISSPMKRKRKSGDAISG
jgi:hypothetical protein